MNKGIGGFWQMRKLQNEQTGFTLLELVVVLVSIIIMVGLIVFFRN